MASPWLHRGIILASSWADTVNYPPGRYAFGPRLSRRIGSSTVDINRSWRRMEKAFPASAHRTYFSNGCEETKMTWAPLPLPEPYMRLPSMLGIHWRIVPHSYDVSPVAI